MGQIAAGLGSAIATAKAATSAVNPTGFHGSAQDASLGMSQASPTASQGTDPLAPLPQTDASQPTSPTMLMALTGQNAASPPPVPAQSQNVDVTPTTSTDAYTNPTDANTPAPVAKDNWTPQHHETTLGKVADFLMMMKGRNPVFRERVDAANEADAFKNYHDNPTDQNLELAARRMSQIPDLAPNAIKLHQELEQSQFYKYYGDMRKQQAAEVASNQLSAMAQSAQKSPDPAGAWTKLYPQMTQIAQSAGLPPPPQNYDPDLASGVAAQGYQSYFDGQRLATAQASEQNRAQIEQADLALRQQDLVMKDKSLKLEALKTGAELNNSANTTNNVNSQIYTRNYSILQKQFGKTPLPTVAPWFLDDLAKRGTSFSPKPGTIYPSPDGSAGVVNTKGGWYLINLQNSNNPAWQKAHPGNRWDAHVIIPPKTAAGASNGDFAQ